MGAESHLDRSLKSHMCSLCRPRSNSLVPTAVCVVTARIRHDIMLARSSQLSIPFVCMGDYGVFLWQQ